MDRIELTNLDVDESILSTRTVSPHWMLSQCSDTYQFWGIEITQYSLQGESHIDILRHSAHLQLILRYEPFFLCFRRSYV
jgi:hypothetical protein